MDNLIKEEWVRELKKPLNINVDEILKELAKFCKEFPVESIPHMSEHDQLKLMEAKDKKKDKSETLHSSMPSVLKPSLSNKKLRIHYDAQLITGDVISLALQEIASEKVARLIGLCAHFSYWVIFGHLQE
jgi:hypothetical protein